MKKIGEWYFTDSEQELDNPMYHFAIQNSVGSNGWQENYTDYVLDFIPHDKRNNCIDIGASYGFLSASFSKFFKNVFAFEINSDVNKCLQKNLKNFSNVHIMNVGLSDCNTTKKLYVDPKLTGCASIEYVQDNIDLLEENVIVLDSLNLSNIDVIKIDVEGHEYSVLQGSIETIKKDSPILLIEMFTYRNNIHDANRKKCIDLLRSLNYEILDVRQHDFVFQKY